MSRIVDEPYFTYSAYNALTSGIQVKCPKCHGAGVVTADDDNAYFRCLSCGHRMTQDRTIYRYDVHNQCKNCGRYFVVTGNITQDYCTRLMEGSEKTCRQMGAVVQYQSRQMKNPATREFTRSYKAHNARVRYGTMTKAEFTAWSKTAREKRDACVAGKLSLEDFVAWLDSDKQR